MDNCPYCQTNLLRHIRQGRVYWFCRSCWQEVPTFSHRELSSFSVSREVSRSRPKTLATASH